MNKGGVNRGRALNVDQLSQGAIERFKAKIDLTGEHWFWTGATTNHNGIFNIGEPFYNFTVNRIMWVLDHGHVDAGEVIYTSCTQRGCLRHLASGTAADMQKNRIAHGHGVNTVDPVLVNDIRRYYLEGKQPSEIADLLGYSIDQVGKICRNQTYPNSAYTPRTQRNARGTELKAAKLDPTKVVEFRRRHKAGEAISTLAREAGLASSSMWDVLHGKTWTFLPYVCRKKHIKGPRSHGKR